MKQRYILFAAAIAAMLWAAMSAHAQNGYAFGCNWFNCAQNLHANNNINWQKFCDSTLGWNTQHVGFDTTISADSSASGWSQVSSAKLIVDHGGGAVNRFSGAERMKYLCLPKYYTGYDTTLYDTLANFDFDSCFYGSPYPLHSPDHWSIPASSNNASVVVMDSNENLNNLFAFNDTWEDSPGTPFKLAVKLQITNTNLSTDSLHDSTILTINVTQRRYSTYPTAYLDVPTYTWNIPWDSISTAGSDVVLFSPVFYFDSLKSLIYPVSDLRLSLSSQRWVTMRLSWVTIEDLNADSLLAGLPENIGGLGILQDSTAAKFVQREIITDARMMQDSIKTLEKVYLNDEAHPSCFASQARCNQILRDSINIEGETERSLYQERRYYSMFNAAGAPLQEFRNSSGMGSPWMLGGAP